MRSITQVDSTLWALISRLKDVDLQTPHTAKNKWFRIDSINENAAIITPRGGAHPITLRRAAFQQTLDYLHQHRHVGESRAITIQSNKTPADAGPLCQAARRQPNGKMGDRTITYILPILERCNAVGINHLITPTSTWLIA